MEFRVRQKGGIIRLPACLPACLQNCIALAWISQALPRKFFVNVFTGAKSFKPLVDIL
jgi:hypothetical protein